jgi:RNA polymerase sigma-70 factor (ECF subfamily)
VKPESGVSDCQEELLELLDRSGARLLALLTRLTLREDVAEELMQDLFVKLSTVSNRTRIDCMEAYARRAAIHLAFDWRRRRRKRQTSPIEDVCEPVSPTRGPLGDAVQKEAFEQILAAIERLNGASREAFVMRYIQQESYEAVAEQLGKTPHQVRALCFRAMNRLREMLGCDVSPAGETGGAACRE